MILSRIKRGAVRSFLLTKHKVQTNPLRTPSKVWRSTRNILLNAMVIRIVVLPIPLLAPSSASAAVTSEESEPPSITRLSSIATEALTFSPTPESSFAIQNDSLTTVTVGKSIATEQAEIAAAEAAAAAAKAAAQRKATAPKQVRTLASVNAAYADVYATAQSLTVAAFGEEHWDAMARLIQRESGFNPNAVNKSSGACGLPQALPCSKIKDTSVEGQITWMINYVRNRYGNPTKALSFQLSHNWY